jgi:hypothetical protein
MKVERNTMSLLSGEATTELAGGGRDGEACGDPGLPPGIPVMHTIHDPRKIVVNPNNRVGITEIPHPLHNEFK